jgi:hypothetical protein
LKYKLIEWRTQDIGLVNHWIANTPAMNSAAKQLNMDLADFVKWLPQALVKSGVAKLDEKQLIDLA